MSDSASVPDSNDAGATTSEGSSTADGRFTTRKLVIAVMDLTGYSRACSDRDALEVAAFLDDYYHTGCAALIAAGGRVVKFIGDSVMAVFPPAHCVDAVHCLRDLRNTLGDVAARHGFRVDLGANVHMAVVAEGTFGPAEAAAYDVLGQGVNHTFLMGGGAGIRISEPVYRQLPSDARGPWRKQKPPATYHLS